MKQWKKWIGESSTIILIFNYSQFGKTTLFWTLTDLSLFTPAWSIGQKQSSSIHVIMEIAV